MGTTTKDQRDLRGSVWAAEWSAWDLKVITAGAAEDFEGVLPRAFYVVADGLVEIRPPNTKGLKSFNARRGVEYRITLSQIGANSAVDIIALW